MAGITYKMAGANWETELKAVMEKYHPELIESGVKVDVMCAFGSTDEDGENIGPAIKVHGIPALAKARIIGLKDRAAGRGDAEIILDGDRCDTWTEEEAIAILDHELTHLELATFSRAWTCRSLPSRTSQRPRAGAPAASARRPYRVDTTPSPAR